MQNLSIKQKTFGLFGVLILATLIASGMIFASLDKAGEDADITNALGRQRMLSQAMGKTALGNAMAKSRKKTIEQNIVQLNRYITKMRANYTKYVVVPVKKAGLQISMEPDTLKHPGVPFPATYTRIVNTAFAKGQDFQIDILSKDPVNADKTLKTDLDKAAWETLKKDPKQVVSRVYEEEGKLYIGLYTADLATVKPCASCHAAIKGRKFNIGDMLGIRSFRLLYSADVGMGRSELNAKLDEYENLKKIFAQTLNAMEKGGEYPADLMGRHMKKVPAIDDREIQNKIKQAQVKFNQLNIQVKKLEVAEVNSLPYRLAQEKILSGSNELRGVSDELVNLYTQVAIKNQTQIRWAVIINLVVVLIILFGIGMYLARAVVNPMVKLAGVMGGVAQGNFMQEKLPVHSSDEMGKLAQTYNTMLDTMRDIVNQSEDIAAGNLSKQYEMKGDLAHAFEKMTQELRDKQEADEKFKAMAEERQTLADDLQKKVDHLLVVVSAAAKGDLTRKIPAMGKDGVGQMSVGLQIFFKRLSESMAAITETANNLARSAKEISSAVSDQASVAQQNSSSVTEISSTVEELAASSSQVAERANAVAEISSNALRESERGMQAMENLKSKMDLISEDNQASIKEIVDLGKRSNEIGKVMEIINNIADQTKLIAFNAAIEASSAGEAGKRFGVVAVEIRRLADNVMESTGDIQVKIDEIQQAINRLVVASESGSKRIYEGAELTGQTIEELERLVDGAKAASDSAQQISLSTGQQKTATDQVLTALKEIVNGSRQSSNAIRQTSSVTSKLSEMSNDLKNMVGKFKIS